MCVRFLGRYDPWSRKWQPAPVFLPGTSQRSLVGYSPQGCRESDMTDLLSIHACRWWDVGEITKKNLFHGKPLCRVRWTLYLPELSYGQIRRTIISNFKKSLQPTPSEPAQLGPHFRYSGTTWSGEETADLYLKVTGKLYVRFRRNIMFAVPLWRQNLRSWLRHML